MVRNDAPYVIVQPRDLKLLVGLFESRIMTVVHIAAIYFEGRREAAKKRLQGLKAIGVISERKRRVNEPSVLFLTRHGHKLLLEHNALDGQPAFSVAAFEKRAAVSELTLRHELEVMDVKAAFFSALRKSERLYIEEFSTWPRLHEFTAHRSSTGKDVLVKPDGFIRIQEKEADGGLSEHTFFLEVDRSSETLETLVNRIGCYLDYYKSGGFALRSGAERSLYKAFPFRVLVVLKSSARLKNTAAKLLENNPPILTFALLSTIAEVAQSPNAKVWVRPMDWKNANQVDSINNINLLF